MTVSKYFGLLILINFVKLQYQAVLLLQIHWEAVLIRVDKPFPIGINAKIGIFTPSEPLTKQRLSRVSNASRILSKYEIDLAFSEHYLLRTKFTAGSILDRVSDIHNLLNNNEISCLLSAWGGKSCCQLLPYLDYKLLKKAAKPILGFSDSGVLSNAILSKSKLITFYGPNVMGKLDETDYANLKMLSNDFYYSGIDLLVQKSTFETIKKGRQKGVLVGGNLSTFSNGIIGTRFEPQFENMILIWESGPKTAQELDTLLWGIKLSKFFKNVKGMIIGSCKIKKDENWGEYTLSEIVNNVFNDINIPILYAPIFGHTKLPNPIFPLGAKVEFNSTQGSLQLLENVFRDEL